MAAQLRQNGIRKSPDPELQAGSVFNQFRTVAPYGLLYFIRLAEIALDERSVVAYEKVYGRQRNHSLTPRPRHIGIHYGNHGLGTFDGGKSCVHRGPEGYESVFVGRANLYHRNIAGQGTAAVEFLGLAQEDRNVVAFAPMKKP